MKRYETFNFPLSPPKSLPHKLCAQTFRNVCPYQTKARTVTGGFTPQRCVQTFAPATCNCFCCCANVSPTTNVCTTTKTVAGCSSKRLHNNKNSRRLQQQTFANVAAPVAGGLRGPLGQAPRARGAPGLACATGARAAAAQVQLLTAWPDRHPLAHAPHVAHRCGARGCMDACRSAAGGVGLGQAPRPCRTAGIACTGELRAPLTCRLPISLR